MSKKSLLIRLTSSWRNIVLMTALLVGSLAIPNSVHAVGGESIIIVDTISDNITSDGFCSLSEAISNANNNAITYSDCSSGGGNDLIEFSLGTATITLTSLLPDLTDTNGLTIDGGSRVIISGDDLYRVFYIDTGVPITIRNLIITAGMDSNNGGGGGIMNYGTLAVSNTTFKQNNTTMYYGGGAINNNGILTVKNSTFSGNTSYNGGAIFNHQDDTAIISNSTFQTNAAKLTGSPGYGYGGAIRNNGTLILKNNTISGNRANATAGGIYNEGTMNLYNTIIADNTSGDCVNSGTLAAIKNLIKNSGAGACGLTNGLNGNIIGSDPALGALTGSPAYFPLMAGSPGIDAGNDSICAAAPVNNTSQNGHTRPQGLHCDIGSYEADVILTLKSAGTLDGWILESGENTNAGGTLDSTATTLRLGDDTLRKQYRSILSFNTGSGLPDNAVISKVTLKVKRQGISGGGNPVTAFQGFLVDIRKGTFDAFTLQLIDWQEAAQKTSGPFTPALDGGWYSINLTGAKAYINKTAAGSGSTQIRLRFQMPDNNNGVANILNLFSGDAVAANRPQLIVEYFVP